MKIHLTEEMIRQRASEQSFDRGIDYYRGRAIFGPSQQDTPAGVVLLGHSEGSSGLDYSIRIQLDASGIQNAICTCPYEWGGDCKHIIALLLTYLNDPEEFVQRKSLAELLEGIDQDGLLALLNRLVENNPDLYDEIEVILPVAKTKPPTQPGVAAIKIASTSVSEQTYRKQVKRILKQSSYEEEDYDEWGGEPGYLSNLEQVQKTAEQLLADGDAEGALIILRVLLEEMIEDYDSDLDYEGYVAGFIQGLGAPLAEAILSTALDDSARHRMHSWIDEILDDIDEDAIEKSDLELIRVALEYGWGEMPDPDSDAEPDDLEEEEWMLLDDLQQAKLNVLERQGRNDEFLKLAAQISPTRYVLKLITLGQVDKALAVSQTFERDDLIFPVAEKLYELGHRDESLALAERNLRQSGKVAFDLGTWLAPIEEKLGRKDMALLAYHSVFIAQPSIELYRKVKKLSGLEWEKLRPKMIQHVSSANSDLRASIHLEEQEWDAAIHLAEKDVWNDNLLATVADAVISHRPDWVIRVSLQQSDELIAKTNSNLYPAAAQWLKRAKQAYQHKGQGAEWQAYIHQLRATYARRPALMRSIAGL